MALKISTISLNKFYPNIKSNKKIFGRMSKWSKTKTLPIVATPLVLYAQSPSPTGQKNLGKNIIKESLSSNTHTPITDRTKTNINALTKAGLTESDAKKHINSDGRIDADGKTICRNNGVTNFHGVADDTHFEPQTLDDTHAIGTESLVYTNASAETDILADTELGNAFDQLAEIAQNPVLEGVAAELLPGTKFLKPLEDLADGDIAKATVGTLTRAGEFAVAPVKLGWAAFGALVGGVSWLAGNRGDGTGLIGGFRQASKMWAKGRNKLENVVIDRNEKDPLAQQRAYRKAYEAETQAEVARIRKTTKSEINSIIEEGSKELDKAKKEADTVREEYNQKRKESQQIRESARATIAQNEKQRASLSNYVRNLRAENERNFRYQREKLAQIEEEIKNAEQKCKTQVQKELAKQKVELENAMKAKEAEALSGINQFLEFLKQYEEIYKKNDAEGFASVAGYDETKNKLATIFGAPLVQNKTNPNVKVPNVIALYGPKGTGKTILGESLAKQFDCEYGGSLLLKMGDDINFERLMPLAEKAKSVFEKTGRRTIIQIDEVEFFGTKQTPSFWKKLRGKPQTFEEFLSCCSEKYGCTMVVTTNEPNKIDESIRTKMKFLYVPVATKKDMAEILKFHVNNRNKEPINYNKLVNLLSEKMTDGTAFTNARLADIVYTVITRNGVLNQKLLEEEILSREPDISKEELDFCKEDFKL